MNTLGRIAYEAAAEATGCEQPWSEANQPKWEAAAWAVTEELARMCEDKSKKLGRRADHCDDDDDAIELKARAWQMVVTAVELRDRAYKCSNAEVSRECSESA